MSGDTTDMKAAINRKMGLYLIGMLGVMGVFAALIIVLVQRPEERAAEEVERERMEAIQRLPEGSETAGRRTIEAIEREAEEAARRRERDLEMLDRSGPRSPGPAPRRDRLESALDPDLLRALEEAQEEAGRRPSFASVPPLPTGTPGVSPGGAGGQASPIAVYEASAGFGAADVFGRDEGPEMVETIQPQHTPPRVIHRGVPIRATLLSRIDTRNEGPITAVVNRDVYDSVTLSQVLIPAGSRMVGDYTTDVSPGVDRIPSGFSRLILPDGRVIPLGSMPVAGKDGTIGVDGRYRSNILSAVGPSFVVAAIGQWMDRQYPARSPTAGQGGFGGVQAPSVAQQVVPEINQAVMERYSGARPYFIAEPGQEIRIIVTQEIEVPEVKS